MINFAKLGFIKKLSGSESTEVTIPSEIAQIRKISTKILALAGEHTKKESALFDIRLCIEEAVRNAIVHGNNSDHRKKVMIEYGVSSGSLYIIVEDQGKGFDYKTLPNPTHEKNILRNSGRGVHLILNLMDAVEFNERGNRIKMIKRLR